MEQPDVQKHAALLIGNLALELATAKAVIEALEARVKALESERTGDAPV